MQVTSKAQFFDLWKKGVLGNRTNLWENPQEAYNSGAPEIGFREIRTGAGSGKWELVTRGQFWDTVQQWKLENRKFVMDDSVPNEHSTMQGEVCRTIRGLESFLAIGYGLAPMRQTMAAGLHKHHGYIETLVLLEQWMDPSSRDDLDALLELYPDATVEFTSFDIDVGNIPGRNTIMWECRNY